MVLEALNTEVLLIVSAVLWNPVATRTSLLPPYEPGALVTRDR